MASSLVERISTVHSTTPCDNCGCFDIEEWVDDEDETVWICAECGEEL